jgi:hypothetical protein
LNYQFQLTRFSEPLDARSGGDPFAQGWGTEAEADHDEIPER